MSGGEHFIMKGKSILINERQKEDHEIAAFELFRRI